MKNNRKFNGINLILLTFVFCALVLATRAQSTDMDNPTPLTTNVITGEGDGKGETLYYSFTATQGDVKVTLDAKTDNYSTPVEVVLMNEDGKELLQITAVAGDKMQRKVGTKHFVREQNVILRISTREDKEVKLLTYKIKLDGAIKIETPSTTVPETTPTPQPLSTNPPIEQPTNTNSQPASINPPTTKIDEKPASLLFSDMAETKR